MIKKIALVLIALSVFGCAKNRDVERVRDGDKENILLKSFFLSADPDGKRGTWLAKMTVVDTSDSPSGTLFVGYQGNVQAGYFDFTEQHLQFRSLTGKLQGAESENIKNSVLMNWNIDHLDYTLDERDGQTINQEIEDNFKTWNQKKYFRIDWSQQKEIANSTNMFPISSFAFFSCWEPSNIRRVDNSMKIEPDHIGFNVEVVYTRLPACANASQWNQGDFNFTATFKYSFRKMEASDYTPKRYLEEQDPARYKYGHFQTVRQKINEKNGRPYNEFLENRWAEKTQHFYFVKGFPEQYKWIWDHTDDRSVLGQTNALLASAKSKLRFEIHDYNYNHITGENNGPEREFGDLRYSFINFIEEIEAGGTPLGYGPSDTNPFTGEIIAANTMVWTGMLGFYVELMNKVGKSVQSKEGQPLESSLFRQLKAALNTNDLRPYTTSWDQNHGIGQLFKQMADKTRYGLPFWNSYTSDELGQLQVPTWFEKRQNDHVLPGENFLAGLIPGVTASKHFVPYANFAHKQDSFGLPGGDQVQFIQPTDVLNINWLENLADQSPASNSMKNFMNVLNNLNKVTDKNYSGPGGLQTISNSYFRNEQARIQANRDGHCIMDMEEFGGGLAGFLQASAMDLSDPAVRADFLNTVLYRVSIHEFGHNLNLRHNFYGSVDQQNFGFNYDKDSIAKFTAEIKGRKVSTNGLMPLTLSKGSDGKVRIVPNSQPVMGDKRVQVSSSVMDYLRLEDEVNTPWAWEDYDVAAILDSYQPKKFDDKGELYLFCTDEHTATSALCNRHDFGTTPSQILMSQIRSYDERYLMRNKRFDRAVWDTSGYASAIFGTMMSMKEFLPLWRAGFAEDIVNEKLGEMGISNANDQKAYLELLNREMRKVMKLTMAFYQAVIQQSRGDRDYYSLYHETTGALQQVGIISDKIFAMMFMAGDDSIYYNPNRIMLYNSFLTYSNEPGLSEFTDQIWRNIVTDRNIAMEPWFINFARFFYAKNATNFSNLDSASLINAMKMIKIDNAEELKTQYGLEMDVSVPVMRKRLPLSTTGTYEVNEDVVVVHVDGSYYMASVTEGHIAYALVQAALDKIQGNTDDDESLAQFNMDIREFHWLYEMAESGAFQ